MKKHCLSILLIIFILSGCGYQLRQSPNISKTHPFIFIQSNNSELKHQLATLLIASGVQIHEQKQSNSSVLEIQKNTLSKKVQSIGANNQVQEYRLEYLVDFSFLDESHNLYLERDYSFDIQQISGGQQEEQSLRKQLVEDMAWAIIRKINAKVTH